jgi:hypothetical protein
MKTAKRKPASSRLPENNSLITDTEAQRSAYLRNVKGLFPRKRGCFCATSRPRAHFIASHTRSNCPDARASDNFEGDYERIAGADSVDTGKVCGVTSCFAPTGRPDLLSVSQLGSPTEVVGFAPNDITLEADRAANYKCLRVHAC